MSVPNLSLPVAHHAAAVVVKPVLSLESSAPQSSRLLRRLFERSLHRPLTLSEGHGRLRLVIVLWLLAVHVKIPGIKRYAL